MSFYNGIGFPRGRWPEPAQPRKAAKRCPRCGRQMVTRTVYLECEGCLYTEAVPNTGARPDQGNPVDKLEAKLKLAPQADDGAAEQKFALSVVPPELVHEYYNLNSLGCLGALLIIGGWGILFYFSTTLAIPVGFRFCWWLFVVTAVVHAAALWHGSRVGKVMGLVSASIMIPVSILTYQLITPEMSEALISNLHRSRSLVDHFLLTNIFWAAAAYHAWLAWYFWRELKCR